MYMRDQYLTQFSAVIWATKFKRGPLVAPGVGGGGTFGHFDNTCNIGLQYFQQLMGQTNTIHG